MAKAKAKSKSKKLVEESFREVWANEPSTVTRATKFGPKGKKGMLAAVAFSKARKRGARVPKPKKKGAY